MPEQVEIRKRSQLQTKTGKVVSDKMEKTVVVAVRNTVMHPLYHRYMKRTSKFYAHDEKNECQMGDEVRIVSSRPRSHKKRWQVQEILKRSEG